MADIMKMSKISRVFLSKIEGTKIPCFLKEKQKITRSFAKDYCVIFKILIYLFAFLFITNTVNAFCFSDSSTE